MRLDTDQGFIWRGEISGDGGKTWRLREDHRMYRAAWQATSPC